MLLIDPLLFLLFVVIVLAILSNDMLGSQNKKYVIVPHNYLKILQIIIDY